MKMATTMRGTMILSLLLLGFSSCSQDMQEQPSYGAQEAPRRHSPADSVPIRSRTILLAPPVNSPELQQQGSKVFAVNCAQCHGAQGAGNGPVAAKLVELPTNLHAPEVRKHPVLKLYQVITDGQESMPGFKGELSAEERWAVAYFIKSFEPASLPDGADGSKLRIPSE
jgi:mono/diheme cytochrome c family protein